MYIAKLKDGPKRVKKTFSIILERVFEMVWWRGRKWDHIKWDLPPLKMLTEDKDQFLEVVIKRMQETQTFVDELKATIELNSILLAQNEELKTKLIEEIQSKEGNLLLSFYFKIISEYTLDWSWSCLTEYKDKLMALDIIPGNPDLVDQAFADLKADLDGEKAARLAAQIKIDVLSRAVKDPKISTDKFAT
jgi:hypothetical protein